jgi:hypothetical protein
MMSVKPLLLTYAWTDHRFRARVFSCESPLPIEDSREAEPFA